VTQTDGRDLILSRVFDAPRALVYQAFVDPDQLARWFAPERYVVPRASVEIDARPGGSHRFGMVNGDDAGDRSASHGTFTEVIENELLVINQEVEGIPGAAGLVRLTLRVELHDEGEGKTRLDLRQGPYTAEIESDARLGWESCFGKLDALLAGA
jgi:uncharacterized protein YndB with AHSA1/START domain